MKASAASTLALALGLLCTVQARLIISSEKRGECPQRISWCDRPPPYNHTCNNDYDCGGTQKCCIEVCTKECRNIVPVILKPGVCPEDPNGCHKIEDDECYGDNHCPGDQKCCVFHCGLKCKNVTAAAVKPKPKPKPGQCPEDNIRCIVAEADECTSDRNCTGDQKCCHFHCGLKCMNATAAPEKSGSCPLPPMLPACIFPAPPTNECATDQECQDDQKCCDAGCSPQCRKPLQDKSGHCPPFNSSICKTARPLPGTCSNDNQCEGTERCCCHGNCRMECTATVKPGTCPAAKLPCTDYSTLDNCTDDGDCEGRQKCCEGCGKHKRCRSPDPDHAGFCPVSRFHILILCTPNNTVVNCSHDLDCPPDEKCCTSVCKTDCVKPLQEKMGECPATKPDQPTAYELSDICNKCNDDKDCTGDFKCCPGSEGKECMSPKRIC
ncbi:uncharacterized protein [Ambystoma mexicanum]|uniref:uncharacterized protein n=1 Tax=Ambystoma mexicanum TaxID=8296 RepID=UPI0037E98899